MSQTLYACNALHTPCLQWSRNWELYLNFVQSDIQERGKDGLVGGAPASSTNGSIRELGFGGRLNDY